jgi:HEAT repeat protein
MPTHISGVALLVVKATIILLAALGITRIMQRASAGARHLVWLVTLATLLLVPSLTAWAPISVPVLGHDSDGSVREMSAWALGQMDHGNGASSSPADAALLAALAHDTNDQVRETAAWALAESEDRVATDALGTAAESDKSARVRATASWALGQLERHSGKAAAGLQHVLKDDDADARLKAAWALGQVGDSSAVPAIQAALSVEHNTEVQRALVRALVKSGGESEKSLTALLNSKEPRVREAAVRALAGSDSFDPWPWPWPRPRPFP